MALPERRTVSAGGMEIAYREAGSGPALVFVHGLGGGSAAWDTQYEAFSDRFRVIAWDGPGYGESGGFESDTPKVADYVRVLAAFLDAVGAPTAHLVGHSLGAIFVASFDRTHPGRAESLVLASPVAGLGGLDPAKREEMRAARADELVSLGPRAFAEKRAPMSLSPKARPEVVQRAIEGASRVPQRAYLQAWNALCDADVFAEIAGVRVPTLVATGSDDTNATPELAQRIAAAIPGAIYRELEGIGHVAYLEHPYRLNAALREFLPGAA